MPQSEHDVVVIGAGIVGVCCALWCKIKGVENVLLIDRDKPGAGTSFGNACTFADYGCVPINNPSLFHKLPKMMLDVQSPLRVDFLYALKHLPWMWKFLSHCRAEKVEQIVTGLAALLRHTLDGYEPLIKHAGAEDLVMKNGAIYVYSSEENYQAARADNEKRRRSCETFHELNENEIYELEPNLTRRFKRGLYFEHTRYVVNPLRFTTRLFETFLAHGGQWWQSAVTHATYDENGVKVFCANGKTVSANKVIVAAGAHSKTIKGSGAEDLPLDTERGYHVLFKNKQSSLNRVVGWAEGGFYAVPIDQGLRVAGTVEIAGLRAPPTQRRIDYLNLRANEMITGLGSHDEDWIGYRPTMPDSLPVIGPSHRSKDVLFAFGHHHLGLTLGGITGKIIADLLGEKEPDIDLTPYRPARFL